MEEEIFAGTNFRELAFDRENLENFCLAKISRYTVPLGIHKVDGMMKNLAKDDSLTGKKNNHSARKMQVRTLVPLMLLILR